MTCSSMTTVPPASNQPIVIRIPQVGYDPVKSVVAIALGSNLDDPQRQLETGLASLQQQPQVEILQISPCFWTEPVVWSGPSGQEESPPAPPYLNGAALLATTLSPQRLMQVLLDVETTQGRTRERKWASRTLDLDILLWEGQRINCSSSSPAHDCETESPLPGVVIPHPRLHERPFVLVPLSYLVPDWIVSGEIGEVSIQQLANATGTHGVDVTHPVKVSLAHFSC
ncbi:MAG: 2-amino-4-hydroxy-6-hydroxymethyldihydropteridine diphosphokinase [Cyanobacteria bacterium P01_E01_bin.45]